MIDGMTGWVKARRLAEQCAGRANVLRQGDFVGCAFDDTWFPHATKCKDYEPARLYPDSEG